MADSNITLSIVLSTDEAIDFATLLHRLDVNRLLAMSWRGLGDTEITVAHWGAVVTRIKDELARLGYPEART
jgi:hypothetical protein